MAKAASSPIVPEDQLVDGGPARDSFPDRVVDPIAVPYLSDRSPPALRDNIDVMERGEGMVLAGLRTPSARFTTTTVETVTFERPERDGFRGRNITA